MSDLKPYWIISPSIDPHYDEICIPVSEDLDGSKAKEYAQDALEHFWDTCEDLEEFAITVKIERVMMREEDVDRGED
jgi:hypothetical protein